VYTSTTLITVSRTLVPSVVDCGYIPSGTQAHTTAAMPKAMPTPIPMRTNMSMHTFTPCPQSRLRPLPSRRAHPCPRPRTHPLHDHANSHVQAIELGHISTNNVSVSLYVFCHLLLSTQSKFDNEGYFATKRIFQYCFSL